MGPHPRAARRAARDRARPQHARRACAGCVETRAVRRARARRPRAMPMRSRRSAPRRSSSARRSRRGPISSARTPPHDLLRLQDALPPLPFDDDPPRDRSGLGRPIGELFASIDEVAGRRRLDRAGPSRGHHRGRLKSRSRCCVPASRRNSRARSTPINGPPRRSRRWAASSRGCARGWSSRRSSAGPLRELDLRREAASASELAEAMHAEPDYRRSRDRLAADQRRAC